jgi:predicted DNA-binding antitoxin AbrB/MazE fold protein
MTINVEATFEYGAFRPSRPVSLPEGTPVHLQVSPIVRPTSRDGERDPLEEVIGICDNGPEVSLAERHDEFIYGFKLDKERHV